MGIIKTLDEYVNQICLLMHNIEDERITDDRNILLFRGHSNTSYRLEPSIARIVSPAKSLLQCERELISTAKRKFPQLFERDQEPLELLANLQHYGIPTRLLDVTENAFVALYFACASPKSMDADGKVYIFQSSYDSREHHLYNGIAESYKLITRNGEPLDEFIKRLVTRPYYCIDDTPINPLDEKDVMGAHFQAIQYETPHFVYPKRMTERQVVQDGRYLLFSNALNKNREIEERINYISDDSDFIVLSLTIDRNSKERMLSELKAFGISKEKLFHDSPDTVLEEVKHTYMASLQPRR